MARDFATTEGVTELTENHWKVINYLRNYYLQFGIAPMIRKLCKETGFKLNEIYQMFPSGLPRAPASLRVCLNRRAAFREKAMEDLAEKQGAVLRKVAGPDARKLS